MQYCTKAWRQIYAPCVIRKTIGRQRNLYNGKFLVQTRFSNKKDNGLVCQICYQHEDDRHRMVRSFVGEKIVSEERHESYYNIVYS
jgi:hypothetical protein